MEIKSWEDYFLDLAKTCASRSNCIRAQVGA
jgi:deoxycytidylate deaminase